MRTDHNQQKSNDTFFKTSQNWFKKSQDKDF